MEKNAFHLQLGVVLVAFGTLFSSARGFCANGWTSDPQKHSCYVVKSTPVTWVEARQWCISRGGDLVSISSETEQKFLNGLVQYSPSGSLWIGLHDRQDEGQFVWVDTSTFSYKNWLAGEPNDRLDEDCGVIGSDGFWRDAQCFLVNGFVCEKDYNKPIPSEDDLSNFNLTTNKTLCGNGWYSYVGFCYHYFDHEVTWITARSSCFSKGGYLLDILTADELSYIKKFMETQNTKAVHIGLNDRLVEGVFVWDDGTLQGHPIVNGTKNWGTDEPNDYNHVEDCTEMQSPPALVWNDIRCGSKRAYICKRAQSPTGTWNATTPVQRTSCPDGYETMHSNATGGAYCYLVQGLKHSYNKLTWSDARAQCQQQGGDLVSIHDHLEMNYISDYVRRIVQSSSSFFGFWANVWIGLNDLQRTYHYKWSDGTGLSYTHWDRDQPTSSNTEFGLNCAMLRHITTTSTWSMSNCFQRQAYICQLTLIPPRVPHQQTAITDKYCSSGWRQFGSYCYLFKTSPGNHVNQSQAQTECKNLGANLASVHSLAEHYFIMAVLGTMNTTDHVFIGLNDIVRNGEYKWTDGTPVVYTAWARGQPNNYHGRQDCTHINYVDSLWNDVSCARKEGYICKKERDQAQPSREDVSSKCLPHWRWSNKYCYRIFQQNNSFDGADSDCKKSSNRHGVHGSLAAVRNRYDNYLLVSLIEGLGSDQKESYWLGLENADGGEFRWTNGAPVTFVRWVSGQPKTQSGVKSCVSFQVKTARWVVEDCNDMQHYVCMVPDKNQEKLPLPPTHAAGSSDAPCPQGWLKHKGRCYGFFGLITTSSVSMHLPLIEPVTWPQAKQHCLGMGADLVSIHDNETQWLLVHTADSLSTGWLSFWTGLNQIGAQRGSYSWTDGSPLDFTYWAFRQPNDLGGSQDCVEVRMSDLRKGYHYRWNDRSCLDRRPFVCSMAAGGTLRINTTLPRVPPGYYRAPCPDGWLSTDTSCFWLSSFETNKTIAWSHARLKCNALIKRKALTVPAGVIAHLATIQTPQDHIVIAEAMRSLPLNSAYWIGLSDKDEEGHFVWADNSSSSYKAWASGEPNNYHEQDCVVIQPNYGYLFNDRSCSNLYPFICSFSRVVRSLTPTVHPPSNRTVYACGNGWSLFQSSCYKVFTDIRLNWHDAAISCTLEGKDSDGDLAVINSNEEQYFILSKLHLSQMYYWIGFSDEDNEDVWRWVDGSPVTFLGWASDQPNNYYNEDCAAVDGKLTTWFDRQCDAVYPYICEMPANLSTLPPPTTGPTHTTPSTTILLSQSAVVSSAPTQPGANKSSSSNSAMAVGLAVGGVLLVLIVILVIIGLLWLRRRKAVGSGRVEFQRIKDDDGDDDDDLLLHDD